MKKITFIAVAFAISMNAISQSKDEIAVASAVETFKNGVIEANRGMLDMITASDLVYGHSSGKVQNKAEFIEEIVSQTPFDYITIDLTEQTIKIVGKTAVVRHTFSSETKNTAGTTGKIFIGNMLIFQKQHGRWKLLARQAYKK